MATTSPYGGYFQLAGALIGAYESRSRRQLEARQVSFQNTMSGRDMAVQNAQANSQWIVARANASLARAQAQAENTVRDANNLLGRASADLSNWSRSVNNNRMLDAAGKEQGAAVANQLRAREADVATSVEGRLAAAEQRGALSAAVALTGTRGSSIDQMSQAFELRDQRRQFYQERRAGYADYDAMQQIVGIVPQAAAGFDTTVTQPSQSYGVSVGPSDPMAPVPGVSFSRQVPYASGNTGTDLLAWFINPQNDAANRQIAGHVSSWFTTQSRDDLSPMY